jgi:hypothetical protein
MLADVDAAGMVDHLDLYDGQTLAHVGRVYAPWHWEQLVEQARAMLAGMIVRA